MSLYLAFIFSGTQNKGVCLREANCGAHDEKNVTHVMLFSLELCLLKLHFYQKNWYSDVGRSF